MACHPHAPKVHPEHQTPIKAPGPLINGTKPSFICRLEIAALVCRGLLQKAAKLVLGEDREGKTFHTAELAFLERGGGAATASVLRGRPNFKPKR